MTGNAHVRIMGIINVTPDSFSDGGLFADQTAAVAQARTLIGAGADILDIGGESTRPYATPVTIDEELSRVIPVIEEIRSFSQIPLSIDTTKAEVAGKALEAGATIINDVSALRNDTEMIEVVRHCDVEVIIMHMQGTPGSMQDNPVYLDVVAEIILFFEERIRYLKSEKIDLNRITIDPGIGFGKKLEHNLSILKHLDKLARLGQPVLLGHSRKRFLGELTGIETPERDLTTAIVSGICANRGISAIRVHDVASTKYALKVSQAIEQAE